jgi:hypothetical protein
MEFHMRLCDVSFVLLAAREGEEGFSQIRKRAYLDCKSTA